MKKSIFILALGLVSLSLSAQKIAKNDPSIVSWAKGIEVNLGTESTSGEGANKLVSYGKPYDAIGVADTGNLVCVSLGNGGSAVATFDRPIMNGEGYDFVVFENAFAETFFELAFVEVSSDGIHYFRFPSISKATETDHAASNYTNLAGNTEYHYGTGFDLSELEDDAKLDKNNIRFVKIVDVISGVSKDSKGNVIYDAVTENTYSAGFDLMGVAVINGGNPYEIADMEGLLIGKNVYETVSTEYYDEKISDDLQIKHYKNGGLVFDAFAETSEWSGTKYVSLTGWGLSNITDNATAKPTDQSGTAYNVDYYTSACSYALEGEGSTYMVGYPSFSQEAMTVYCEKANEFYPKGVYVNQSLSSYNDIEKSTQADLYFKVKAKGFDLEGKAVDSTELYFVNKAEGIQNSSNWKYLNLDFGKVAKVKFEIQSNNDYLAAYLCIDNFVYSIDNKNAINNAVSQDINVSIYPNPSKDRVMIENVENANIRIFDLQGRMIMNIKSSKPTMEINNLAKGTYFVNIVSDKATTTKKLIMQ